MRAATESNDPHPYDVQAVATTSGNAQNLRGTSEPNIPTSTPVYLIAMRGEFDEAEAKEPGATVKAEARSSVMTLEIPVESHTGSGIVRGWADSYPDLASLGTPVEL